MLDRVLAYGDEWMPNRIGDDEKISARIARLRQAGEDAGRGPIPTTLANATDRARTCSSSTRPRASTGRCSGSRQGDESDPSAASTGSRPGDRAR